MKTLGIHGMILLMVLSPAASGLAQGQEGRQGGGQWGGQGGGQGGYSVETITEVGENSITCESGKTYTFNPNPRILKDGKQAGLSDFQPGMKVRVKTNPNDPSTADGMVVAQSGGGGKAPGGQTETIAELGENSLKTSLGKAYTTTNETKIMAAGKQASLAELAVGMIVTITPRQDDPTVAQMIYSRGQPAGGQTPPGGTPPSATLPSGNTPPATGAKNPAGGARPPGGSDNSVITDVDPILESITLASGKSYSITVGLTKIAVDGQEGKALGDVAIGMKVTITPDSTDPKIAATISATSISPEDNSPKKGRKKGGT